MGEVAKARGQGRVSCHERIAVVEANQLLASGLAALISKRRGDRSEVLCFSTREPIGHVQADILVIGPGWPGEHVPNLLREVFEIPSRIRALRIEPRDAQPESVPSVGRIVRISEHSDVEVLMESLDSLSRSGEPRRIAQGATQESRLLSLVQEGLTNREIAARLYLAESTVKWHVSKLLRSLGVRNRTELSRLGHHRHGAHRSKGS